jgi:hypothetical protein
MGWPIKNQNIGTFTDGYAIQKFRNVTVNGVQVQISDSDFFPFGCVFNV